MVHFSYGPYHFEAHLNEEGRWRAGRGPKMFDAGAMRYVVLQLLAAKPRHGYEIIKEIEQMAGGSYSPSPGAIYPLLAMLLDMGHIETVADGNKKLHSITDEGRAFLQENQQMVDAVVARLTGPAAGRADLRHLIHDLKAVVLSQVKRGATNDDKAVKIAEILRRTIAEVEQLK